VSSTVEQPSTELSRSVLFFIIRTRTHNVLQLILFNIVPTFIDIFVALGMFCYFFEWTLALVIFFVMFTYGEWCPAVLYRTALTQVLVAASIILTKYRTRVRRQMNERDIVRLVIVFYTCAAFLRFTGNSRHSHRLSA